METNVIPAWHYIWKCSYWWLLSVCQISCLYLKVDNSPEISSYVAELENIAEHKVTNFFQIFSVIPEFLSVIP